MIDYKKLKQALDEINKIACSAYNAKYFGDLQISDVQSLLNEVLDIVENSGECSMHWISVNERLPEEQYSSVIFTDGKKTYYGFSTVSKFYDADDDNAYTNAYTTDEVTHWMPLPEPPEMNENE